MTVYFVRHGESTANAAGVIADEHADLTDKGERQAQQTARDLVDVRGAILISSPFKRAKRTAEIIAESLNIEEITTDDRIRERGLGDLENHPKREASEYYFYEDGVHDFENQDDLIKRLVSFKSSIEQLDIENVIVVGHAVSGFYLNQILQGKLVVNDFDSYEQVLNASVQQVEL